MIHERLKNEFKRLDIKAAAAAKTIGETDSQGLRDVLGGRKRLTAEMLAALAATGVDVLYVLTGQRGAQPAAPLAPDEAALLDNYRHSPKDAQDAMKATSAAFAQRGRRRSA